MSEHITTETGGIVLPIRIAIDEDCPKCGYPEVVGIPVDETDLSKGFARVVHDRCGYSATIEQFRADMLERDAIEGDGIQTITLHSFFVTFGTQYNHEPHPLFRRAHPDGWFTIDAPDEDTARRTAFGLFGTHWAFLYDAEHFQSGFYPRGEVGYAAIYSNIDGPEKGR